MWHIKTFHIILGLFILMSLFSCRSSPTYKPTLLVKKDSLKSRDSLASLDSFDIIQQKLLPVLRNKYKVKFTPVWRKRIYITGTFADSTRIDTLNESYISRLTKRETCNDYDIPNYNEPEIDSTHEQFIEAEFIKDTLINIICRAKPRLMLKSSNPAIKTLYLNDTSFDQVTGIEYLINVGDVNSDGKDDLAVVCNYIRFAGCTNSCRIFSYKFGKWQQVLHFDIREPACDMDPKDFEKLKIINDIPGFLEKKNGKWYYRDYNWQGLESERRLLKIK